MRYLRRHTVFDVSGTHAMQACIPLKPRLSRSSRAVWSLYHVRDIRFHLLEMKFHLIDPIAISAVVSYPDSDRLKCENCRYNETHREQRAP